MEEIKNKKEQDPIRKILYDNLEMLWSKLEKQNDRILEIDSYLKGGPKTKEKKGKVKN